MNTLLKRSVVASLRPNRTARRLALVALALVLVLSATSCAKEEAAQTEISLPEGTLTIAYSPEKEDLFLKLVMEFNLSRPPDIPPVHAVRRDMADMLEEAVDGEFGAISPDSSIWLAELDPSLVGDSTCYALSPVVIAMWESTAFDMGYPGASLSWDNLMQRAMAEHDFRWSHPSVRSAAGLLTVIAECYAATGKQANLTMEDLEAEATFEYIRAIESTVERYGGESEDKVVMRILGEGGYPLDAFVAQEQMVTYFNQNTPGENLVAIYPEEGTFWMDHPLVLLEGPWVTEEQRLAFQSFAEFVTEPEQQQLVLGGGYKVDPTELENLLEVPSPDIVAGIWDLWHLAKRRANIYLVADVSGSMQGEKIVQAKEALLSFVDQIESDQEQVALVQFSDRVRERVPLDSLGNNRASLKTAIQQLSASGGTALYDAIAYAFDALQELNDVERINVVLVMTDGMNTAGSLDLAAIQSRARETDIPILIFCVGYGSDADMDALSKIARATDVRAYIAEPGTISKLYELLSAFF